MTNQQAFTCTICDQRFIPPNPSYNQVCSSCSNAIWRERRAAAAAKTRPALEVPRTYTCKSCEQEFQSTFDTEYPDLMECGGCKVADIMKYADTFGVD